MIPTLDDLLDAKEELDRDGRTDRIFYVSPEDYSELLKSDDPFGFGHNAFLDGVYGLDIVAHPTLRGINYHQPFASQDVYAYCPQHLPN